MSDKQWRWLLAGLSAALVTLPLLLVTFPPSIDLPQHVAQVRLFSEALHNPAGPYKIQWFTPYSAITMLLGLLSLVASPVAAGRMALILMGLSWTAAAHWLADRRQRSAEAAVLASIFYLGLSFYRGFCSFLIGWPVFLVWFQFTSRPPDKFRRRDAGVLFALGVLLYLCHALWFATALGWLGVSLLLNRPPRRVWFWQLGAVAPLVLGAAVWWAMVPHTAYARPPEWLESPLQRLSPIWLSSAAFIGLKGPFNFIILMALALWCAVGLWQHRASLRAISDRPLAALAGLFVAGGLLLPSQVSFTICFAERFVGCAFVLVLLAVPAPRLRPALARVAALGLVAVFCSAVAMNWMLSEREELMGLAEAIEAAPENARLLELDMVHLSSYLQGHLFTHVGAYTQAAKGGVIGFSFAEMPSPLVVFKDPVKWRKWQADLEWHGETVRPADLRFFDYVLLGARDARREQVLQKLPLEPVTQEGLWRLYKIQHPPGAEPIATPQP